MHCEIYIKPQSLAQSTTKSLVKEVVEYASLIIITAIVSEQIFILMFVRNHSVTEYDCIIVILLEHHVSDLVLYRAKN